MSKEMGKVCPQDILNVGSHNHLVHSALMYWREGVISWEQMMMWLVVLMDGERQKLLDRLVELSWKTPSVPIVVEKESPK